MMYRDLLDRQDDLLDRVRVAALSDQVSPDRLIQFFPDLVAQRGGVVPKVLSADEAVEVAEIDDDFDGETIFEMDHDEVLRLMREMGQDITLVELDEEGV